MVIDPNKANALSRIASSYSEKQRGLTITVDTSVRWGQVNPYLEQVLAGTQQGPDLILLDAGDIPYWARRGLIEDLTPSINLNRSWQTDLSKIPAPVRSAVQREGRTLAVPIAVDSTVIAYLKDDLAAVGLDDLAKVQDRWTYQTLAEYARRLSVPDAGRWGLQLSSTGWLQVLWGHGGDLFDAQGRRSVIRSDQAMAALRWLHERVFRDRSIPAPGEFRSGSRWAMWFTDASQAAQIGIRFFSNKTAWNVAEVPLSEGRSGQRVSALRVWAVAVNAKSRYKREALAFVRALAGKQEQETMSSTIDAALPARSDAWSAFLNARWPNLPAYRQAFTAGVQYGRPLPALAQVRQAELVSGLWREIQRGFREGSDLEGVLAAADSFLTQALAGQLPAPGQGPGS